MKKNEKEYTQALTQDEQKHINGGSDGADGWDIFTWAAGLAGAGGAAFALVFGLGLADAKSGKKASQHIYLGY